MIILTFCQAPRRRPYLRIERGAALYAATFSALLVSTRGVSTKYQEQGKELPRSPHLLSLKVQSI